MEDNNVLRVVMFPWLATGHLIPFLELSKCLARRGHHVSFVSTPRNLQRLPKIPSQLQPFIDFVSFPLAKVENLPDEAESSMDIPYQKAQFLKIAFDSLEPHLASFLETTKPKPDWIIYDYASHWLPSIASKLGISGAYFSLFNAANMAFIGPPSLLLTGGDGRSTAKDYARVPDWIPFPSKIAYRVHEIMKYVESATGNESGASDTIRFAAAVDGSELVIFRTRVEFEPEYFNLVCELYQKPVISVGVLPPSLEVEDHDCGRDEKWAKINDWLDKQRVSTMVYIALGTEATLSQEELSNLAVGLEQCGLPFFWVLRKPPGLTGDYVKMLPDGFQERVRNRGVIYMDWAPQVKILSHPAIGGFLTHCGWNSVVEALSFGRVLILFPVMNDQGLNARLLQEKRVGIEIPRNEEDGSFTSDSVAEAVKLAVVSEEGEAVRTNARSMRSLFGDKTTNDGFIDICIRYLLQKKMSSSMA